MRLSTCNPFQVEPSFCAVLHLFSHLVFIESHVVVPMLATQVSHFIWSQYSCTRSFNVDETRIHACLALGPILCPMIGGHIGRLGISRMASPVLRF